MSTSRQYNVSANVRQTCNILGLSPARVLARCGLDAGFLHTTNKGVDAATYFALWTAFAAESADPELPLTLGRGVSRGPFQPALLAFSASPDIYTGLKRLAVFKPLCAPIRLELKETDRCFSVAFAAEDGYTMPAIMATTEVIFFLDFARTFTAHYVVPQTVQLPDPTHVTRAYRDYIGAPIEEGRLPGITFTMEDARRPLISADTDFYRMVEQDLLARLESLTGGDQLSNRVRRALTEMLPAGMVSADRVSARLGLSKRSLQRKLKEEGTSFQAVLDETRASLALTYLRDQKLSAEETSYLLAYQDPNSFYRAFHEWTGMTPAQARSADQLTAGG